MPRIDLNLYEKDFDEFADGVGAAVRKATADYIESYTGDMPDAVQWYAAVSGMITAAGFLTKGMIDLFGLDPTPLLKVLPDQFREGMAGPVAKETVQ